MNPHLTVVFGLVVAVYASNALAQTPLEQHFQGRRATVLLDMPGDDSGVDLRAHATPAVDADLVKKRVDKYGAGLQRGQAAVVTLVKFKGDNIEFHLNGGGFTNRQWMGLPRYDSAHWGKTEQEKRLQHRISGTSDPKRRKDYEEDYDDARRRRIKPLREKLEREERAKYGSRINVRFASDREAAAITPEQLTTVLKPYVEFR